MVVDARLICGCKSGFAPEIDGEFAWASMGDFEFPGNGDLESCIPKGWYCDRQC